MPEELSTPPPEPLDELEAKVHNGLLILNASFYVVGKALSVISGHRLYKERGYSNFEAYVQDTFRLSKQRAYELMHESEVVENVPELKYSPASHAAALIGLPAEVQREVHAIVKMLSYENDTKATAEDVRSTRLVFTELMNAPVVDDDSGETVWLRDLDPDERVRLVYDSILRETRERKQRQKAHVEEGTQRSGWFRARLDDADDILDKLLNKVTISVRDRVHDGLARDRKKREMTLDS